MTKIYKICLLVFSLFLFCVQSAYAYIDKDKAVIAVMDKVAGKTQNITIPVDTTATFDKLSISIKSCKLTDPFEAENSFAFIEIYTQTDGKIFSNWLNHNEPGQNPLQNQDYDIWLIKCE